MAMDEATPATQEQMNSGEMERLQASDWLWHPWYAKLWWVSIPFYWGGRVASEMIASLAEIYDNLIAGYLIIVCNPVIATAFLGFGFARAKLARGEWVITPGPVHLEGPIHIERRPGELLDPYTDFTDPRSGIRYLEHRGLLHDHDH